MLTSNIIKHSLFASGSDTQFINTFSNIQEQMLKVAERKGYSVANIQYPNTMQKTLTVKDSSGNVFTLNENGTKEFIV